MTSLSDEVVGRRNYASPRVSVVVPAKNEALSLAVVLPQIPLVHEVIVVDGGSVDGTAESARRARPGTITIEQARRGKGNALASGFAQATGDIIVVLEADGSCDPAEIPGFIDALVRGADFATGSRFLPGGRRAGTSPLRRAGNAMLSRSFSRAFRSRCTDLAFVYSAFWADLLPLLDLPDPLVDPPRSGDLLWGDGPEIGSLIRCRLTASGVDVVEVVSQQRARLFGEAERGAGSEGLRVWRTLRTERARARGMRRIDARVRGRSTLRMSAAETP